MSRVAASTWSRCTAQPRSELAGSDVSSNVDLRFAKASVYIFTYGATRRRFPFSRRQARIGGGNHMKFPSASWMLVALLGGCSFFGFHFLPTWLMGPLFFLSPAAGPILL